MNIQPEFMGKLVEVTTNDGKVFTGRCFGIYGSVQCDEEYGYAEMAMTIMHGYSETIVFENQSGCLAPCMRIECCASVAIFVK